MARCILMHIKLIEYSDNMSSPTSIDNYIEMIKPGCGWGNRALTKESEKMKIYIYIVWRFWTLSKITFVLELSEKGEQNESSSIF